MNIAEDFYLLSCDPDTGRLHPVPDKLFDLVIGGALLFDLSFKDIINDDWEKLEIISSGESQDVLINETIHSLSVINKSFTLSEALTIMAARANSLEEIIIANLIKKGRLKLEKHISFRSRGEKKFLVEDKEGVSGLVARIRHTIIEDTIPDPELCAMISLLKTSRFETYLFNSTELAKYRKRIDFLANIESLGRAISEEVGKLKDKDLEKISEEVLGLRQGEPKAYAGGIDSVISSISHVYSHSGIKKGKQLLQKLNQKNGFECSGCSWPNPDKRRSRFEFCESGAKNVSSEVSKKTISVDFFKKHSITELKQQSEYWLEQQGRLTHPVIRKAGAGHYEPISWNEAYGLIGSNLKRLNNPDEAAFYVSGRTSNEASFLIQLLARIYGTNNLPNSANLCHDPSGTGLKKSLGFGKGSVGLEDFPLAESIFIFGHNPGSNHPRMLKSLQAAVRNSCKIVAVNPMVEPSLLGFSNPQEVGGFLGKTTKLASLYIQPGANGDMALIKGMMKIILEKAEEDTAIIDHEFIERYTSGFREFSSSVKSHEWDGILESSGLSYQEIEKAAEIYMNSKRTIITWCLGITQHVNSVATIQEIVNLLLLKGNIGKAGAGVCPVRGHSNVQGNRTMGVGENMPDDFISKQEERFQFRASRKKGLDAVSCIKAMHKEKVKVMISIGGNLAAASPDTEYTSQAMGKCDLTVMVSTKLNRNHLITGKTALILPCLSRAEKDIQNGKKQAVLIESAIGKAEFSYPHIEPCSPDLQSEIRIIAEIAKAVLPKNNNIDWEEMASDYSKIRKLFTETVPDYSGYDEKRCKKQGFYLYNPLKERVFKTDTGKAIFSTQVLNTAKCEPGELMLMSVRSHDQFNTGIFGLSDRYRGIKDERRVAFMNEEDMEMLGIKPEQIIDISSNVNGEEKRLTRYFAIPYKIKKGSIAVYFPEANILFPIDHVGIEYPTPAFKSLPVKVSGSEYAWQISDNQK